MSDRVRIYSREPIRSMFAPSPDSGPEQVQQSGLNSQRPASRNSTGTRGMTAASDATRSRSVMGSTAGSMKEFRPPSRPSTLNKPVTSIGEFKRQRLQKFWDEAKRDKLAGEKRAQDKRAKAATKRDAEFKSMITKLEDEKALVAQVGDYLALKEATDQRKKVQLFEEWSQSVFDPIQETVKQDMAGRDIMQIEERKRKNFEEYLYTVGRKQGGVFRDIVIEQDYDPFKDHAHTIKYNGKKVNRNDPLRREKNKVAAEQKITLELNPDAKYIHSQSRKGLNILLWDKLDATPYARYEEPPKPTKNDIRKTTFVLDHFNTKVDQNQVRKEYFQAGKRTFEVDGGYVFKHQEADIAKLRGQPVYIPAPKKKAGARGGHGRSPPRAQKSPSPFSGPGAINSKHNSPPRVSFGEPSRPAPSSPARLRQDPSPNRFL